jgi:hypothetical protein
MLAPDRRSAAQALRAALRLSFAKRRVGGYLFGELLRHLEMMR